jgi:hypothetical protein
LDIFWEIYLLPEQEGGCEPLRLHTDGRDMHHDSFIVYKTQGYVPIPKTRGTASNFSQARK